YQGKISPAQLSREPQMRLQMPASGQPLASSAPAAPPEALARALNPSPGAIPNLRVPAPTQGAALSTALPAAGASALTPAGPPAPGAPFALPAFVGPAPAAAFSLTLLPATTPSQAGEAAPRGPGVAPAATALPGNPAAAPPAAEAAQARGAGAEGDRVPLERELNSPLPGQAGGRELVEPLQDILQRQLQVLAAPVLRWEGDIWTGLFMALMIQPPREEIRERQPGAEGGREEADGEEGAWRSEFSLSAGELGALRVQLWLRGSELDLTLRSGSAMAHARLEGGLDALRQRLRGCGFPEPRLSLLLDEEGAGHG